MKEKFRQSMTWLHTWVGLLVGWVLFFVFLTGTFGYVNAEVDRWMRPEVPLTAAFRPTADLVAAAERRLRERAGDAEFWQIILPAARGTADLLVRWRARAAGDEKSGSSAQETLDPDTGAPIVRQLRETGGGNTLYVMHYALHYVPPRWGYCLVGICTMFMLVAILTGIVAHKNILKDYFTLRLAKGQRSWRDGHNLLAVAALPFHVMITWSGFVFFLATYMPVAVNTLYPDGAARERYRAEAYGVAPADRDAGRPAAPLVPLVPLLHAVEDRWKNGAVGFVHVDHPGRDNARVTFYAQEEGDLDRTRTFLRFDGVTGVPIESDDGARTAVGRFNGVLLGLHEGRFAGPVLRFLYVLAGLVGTAMIGTGLVLWSIKRKARLRATDRPHFGIAVVDVLNLGTIVGLPIGIATYFWANRLLPVGMEGRAAWEVHVLFITWGLCFLYAAIRPLDRGWVELCRVAAAACALLPLLNALTTDRHLGASIASGDWIFVRFDLSALAAGAFFAGVAQMIQRKRRTATRLPEAAAARMKGEAAE